MKFCLVDRIDFVEPGRRLQAVKLLTLSEEYLSDHFPRFPVMPGVFMLEALTQASAWLVRVTEEFSHSIVTLKEAKGIKYADFVEPGSTLRMDVEWMKSDGEDTLLKVQGAVDGRMAVSGRLLLSGKNLSHSDVSARSVDANLIREFRAQFGRLHRPPRRVEVPVGGNPHVNGFARARS